MLPCRPEAAAAAFARLQQGQHVLSASTRGHLAGRSAQLRGSAGSRINSPGGIGSSLQMRGFGSLGHSTAWPTADFGRVPRAVAPAAGRRMQPFAAAVNRLLGRSSSWQTPVQQPVWQPLQRQSPWQRRHPGGGGARQLLALAACAQRWVQRPMLRL